MTSDQVEKFNKFLSESFEEGLSCRELRLSEEEMEYIKKIYPRVSFKKIASKEHSDRRVWFEVKLGCDSEK